MSSEAIKTSIGDIIPSLFTLYKENYHALDSIYHSDYKYICSVFM